MTVSNLLIIICIEKCCIENEDLNLLWTPSHIQYTGHISEANTLKLLKNLGFYSNFKAFASESIGNIPLYGHSNNSLVKSSLNLRQCNRELNNVTIHIVYTVGLHSHGIWYILNDRL